MSSAAIPARSKIDKRRITRTVARYLVNPLVSRVAGYVPWWALLETQGRRSGRSKRNPVGNGLDGKTFWIVAEHGDDAAYIKNIKADPHVRVRVAGRWRSGIAHILYDDDARERQRRLRAINAALVRLMGTNLLTVRVDLDPQEEPPPELGGVVSEQVVAAALVAAAASGLPSTLHALATGRSALEATEAAGSILLPNETRRSHLVAAAVPLHLALSLLWSVVIARTLQRSSSPAAGAAAGLGIAVIDLMIIGRRWPRVRALPLAPQVADHVAFSAIVVTMLQRSHESARTGPR